MLVKFIREDVTDELLAAAFASCGKIMSAVVHRDPDGKSKRHGFVNFELPEAALKCIEQFNDSGNLAIPGDRIMVLQHLKRSEYHRQASAHLLPRAMPTRRRSWAQTFTSSTWTTT